MGRWWGWSCLLDARLGGGGHEYLEKEELRWLEGAGYGEVR